MTEKSGYVYIMTNPNHSTLYVGVTSNLRRRVEEHQLKRVKGFTARYNLNKLVYFEAFTDMASAITREKYLKGKSRAFKNQLIAKVNPEWNDLIASL